MPPPTAPLLIGLDIETDTSVDGLDPGVSAVRAVGVACSDAVVEAVCDADERAVLEATAELLSALDPGIVVTWNGAAFDLPFLATRAWHHGLDLGLRLRHDPSLRVRSALPGHPGAYRATWGAHRHLDAYRVWRNDWHRAFDLSCSLKSVARLCGLAPVEVDVSRLHDLPTEAVRRYVASDARLACELASRRWCTAWQFIDPPHPPGPAPAGVASIRG